MCVCLCSSEMGYMSVFLVGVCSFVRVCVCVYPVSVSLCVFSPVLFRDGLYVSINFFSVARSES